MRIDGEIVSLKQVIAAKEGKTLPTIELKDDYMQTVTGKSVEVKGIVTSYNKKEGHQLFLKQGDSSIVLPVSRNGEFKANLDLKQGTNYFDLLLMQDGVDVGRTISKC